MALALITGGSRGIGRAIAVEAAKSLQVDHVVLMSRGAVGMAETQRLMKEANPSVSSAIHEIDFSDVDSLEEKLDFIFRHLDPSKYKAVYLFNNHGSLGPLTQIRNQTDFRQIRKDIDLNLTSSFALSALFLRHFTPAHPAPRPPLFLVNTSTLAAVKAFASWGVYSSGKAGKDMLYSIIAEEEDSKHVKTLNYAPGPCDTDMQKDVREKSEDESTRQFYADMHRIGKLVDPYTSAKKLIKLLAANTFASGSHIDFYDE